MFHPLKVLYISLHAEKGVLVIAQESPATADFVHDESLEDQHYWKMKELRFSYNFFLLHQGRKHSPGWCVPWNCKRSTPVC